MIENPALIALVAIASLTTILVIALGFLPHPSRAAAIWSAAFAVSMAGCYVWLAGSVLDLTGLRMAGAVAVMAGSALIWVGLRAWRGATRVYLVPTELVYVVAIAAAVASTGQPWQAALLHLALAITAVGAGLTAGELMRLRPFRSDESLPLTIASLSYVALAALVVIDGVTRAMRGTPLSVDEIVLRQTAGAIGVAVYMITALTTLLLLIRGAHQPTDSPRQRTFDTVARDRLERAQQHDDRWWSLLDIRLDEPGAIRAASSSLAYSRVVARFADDLRAALPADVDIDRRSETRYIALVPRPEPSVRPLMSQLLERVATPSEGQGLNLRPSASIGWASVTTVGYDLDRLLTAAADAAVGAARAGGDRWERASLSHTTALDP